MSTEEGGSATSSLEASHLQGDLPESPANGNVDALSDAGESMQEIFPSNSYALAEDHVSCDGSSPDQSSIFLEMVDGETEVSFCPDYIVYGDIYCTDSKVTFTANCVQVNGSTPYGNKGTFHTEFAIDDVVNIQSLWSGRFQMAEVKIYVNKSDSLPGEDISGISGIQVLKFAVIDNSWHEKSKAIVSLNLRYKALWNDLLNTYAELDQETLLGQKPISMQKGFLPTFEENFEEVVYPQGDIDAVSISMRDVDLLKPDTFINDTIIDFYIKYLKNKILPEERHRFHFFNCFFFRKLADMDKDPSSAFQGRAAFLRVRKWTRKVNLFDKDFIFIPVNYNYHWSLIVICHPGEVANIKVEGAETLSDKVPCILHMDSLRGSHANLKDLMQSYLWEEWKERQKETVEDISSKFLDLRFVSLELPQQQNLYDCGLFLLHYVELFLENAPANFSPFMITQLSNFLKENWFPPPEPSIKRSVIHRLIHDLLNKQSQCPANNARTNHDSQNSLELIVERSSLSNDSLGHLPDDGQRIETDLLQASSLANSHCAGDSGLGFRDFFESTSSEAMFIDAQYRASYSRTTSFDEFRSGLAPIEQEEEEEMEAELCFIHTTSNETHFPEPCGLQSASEDDKSEKPEDIDSSQAKPTSDSDPTSEVEIADNSKVSAEDSDYLTICGHTMEIAASQTHPVQTLEYLTPRGLEVAAASCWSPVGDGYSPVYLKNLPADQTNANDTQENDGISMQVVTDDLRSEEADVHPPATDDLGSEGSEEAADVHPPAKKIRLMSRLEESTTLSTDLDLQVGI